MSAMHTLRGSRLVFPLPSQLQPPWRRSVLRRRNRESLRSSPNAEHRAHDAHMIFLELCALARLSLGTRRQGRADVRGKRAVAPRALGAFVLRR